MSAVDSRPVAALRKQLAGRPVGVRHVRWEHGSGVAAAGERLEAGDRIITGPIVQAPVVRGDEVVGDLGELGRVGLARA